MFSVTIARQGIGSPYDETILSVTGGRWSDVLLIKSIISTESAWDPNALREEPRLQDASRGLMQILFATAQWMGYGGDPEGLFDPQTNLRFGWAYLRYLMGRYAAFGDYVSAYNGGHPLQRRDGLGYTNQQYVDTVNQYFAWYQSNHPPLAGGEGSGSVPDATQPSTGIGTDSAGNLIDLASGDPIVSAVDTVTGDTVDLADVQFSPAGAAFNLDTGNAVILQRLDSSGQLVPVTFGGTAWGSMALLIAGVFLLALIARRR